MLISIIVATAQNNVIGKNNELLWHLPVDLKYFKALTTGHCIIMGRKTYQSIGRALPNRTNIIVSRSDVFSASNCCVVHSLEEAILFAQNTNETECFVIGGAEIYAQALPMAHKIYLTEVNAFFEGDAFFPAVGHHQWHEISRTFIPKDEKNAFDCSFVELQKQ